ncbi:hypothetical protein FPOAC2_03849 [Fusarium poae]|uniref:hypothetical protein n=1 Tax=Fusarium poae TaxID=36050 RepID=UPI001CEA1372|nr:hypothetical protein FPOAC1_003753 [Fusarium poae]KAG8677725.1 hypothetical protein FPOAC1_003753 [Fusarium poae]
MPITLGPSVTCSILLAEPNLFLWGFDQHCERCCEGHSGTSLLRGTLQLCVNKNTRIKAVQLRLLGHARTEWPQAMESDFCEEETLQIQLSTLFSAMSNFKKYDYGSQCTYQWRKRSPNNSDLDNRPETPSSSKSHYRNNVVTKGVTYLSNGRSHPRNVNRGRIMATPSPEETCKVFYPGIYNYTFELPIDHRQLETTKTPYGSVKWELHTTVDRSGRFRRNIQSKKELSFVRVPDPLSVEMMESVVFSRQWEDQLRYDITIFGKSFASGSNIPIILKLRPLDKIQVHGLRVTVTEAIEYSSSDKKVTRKSPARTVLLFDKRAGKAPFPTWTSSDIRTVRDDHLTLDPGREASETGEQQSAEASGRHTAAQPLSETRNSLLGNPDPRSETFWDTTEIQATVQLPTCRMMAKREDLRLHPKCMWTNVNISHTIEIIVRISRLDPVDTTRKRRRYFETSVYYPFTLLNCRATQANMTLPSYSKKGCQPVACQTTCGCPDALVITTPATLQNTRPSTEMADVNDPDRLTHVSGNHTTTPYVVPELLERGFMSPPPQYDDIVGSANVNGRLN